MPLGPLFPSFDFDGFRENLSTRILPFQRPVQFWVRTADIYTGYKVAQIVGKPDLAPAAWVKRLVTLCDQAPATPYHVIRPVIETELGRSIDDLFKTFDVNPPGSASIAQVHRARLSGDKNDVVVKVQHPGVQNLMMTDLRNLQAFTVYLQKTDIQFDFHSVMSEMAKQIGYEFDFTREAAAMERIRQFLQDNNKKGPVKVPRVVKIMVTRRVLVMEYINGIPVVKLGDEMANWGLNPGDPHPGNILICKGSKVALIDYGQVKDLPENLRLGYANLVIAIADDDPMRAIESLRELGIITETKCENEQQELFKLAQSMFDTKLPPGVKMLQPFSEESSIKKVAVQINNSPLITVCTL